MRKCKISFPSCRNLSAWTNRGVHLGKVAKGQRSAELWRLSWQGWLFTGSVLWREKAGEEQRDSVSQGGRERASGADMSYLLSCLVRAQVRTVMCMLVDVTSGLQGTQAWALPDPGGWHGDVKSGTWFKEGASRWGCFGLNKETLWQVFSVCCQTSNY